MVDGQKPAQPKMQPSSHQPSTLNHPLRLTIRPIEPADWPVVDRIQRAAFDASVIEKLVVFESFAAFSPTTCLLATAGERALGYLLAHPWIPDDLPPLNTVLDRLPENAGSLFIHDLALNPDARGQRVGRALVKTAFAAGKKLRLTSASLLAVQASGTFWQHQGFLPRPDLTPHIEKTVRAFTAMEFLFMSRPDLTTTEPAEHSYPQLP